MHQSLTYKLKCQVIRFLFLVISLCSTTSFKHTVINNNLNRCISSYHNSNFQTSLINNNHYTKNHFHYYQQHSKLSSSLNDDISLLTRIYNYVEDIDEKYTNGFMLLYANTTGYNITEPIGSAFLFTNIVYFISSITFLIENSSEESFYYKAFVIEMAGLLSINYHYKQLVFGPNNKKVRYALLLDYFAAFSAIFMITIEILYQSIFNHNIPLGAIELGIGGTACLLGSWIYINGLEYIIWHGLWHIFSGAASYELYHHVS